METYVVGSSYSQELVFERYVKPFCEKNVTLQTPYLHVNWKGYLGAKTLPKRQIVAELKTEDYLEELQLREVHKISMIFAKKSTVKYGSKFLVIGTTRESNPVDADGLPRDSTPGWSYCWISYLHKHNAAAFIIPDGTTLWYTCKKCPSKYHVRVRTMDDPFYNMKIVKKKEWWGFDSWQFESNWFQTLSYTCNFQKDQIADCDLYHHDSYIGQCN